MIFCVDYKHYITSNVYNNYTVSGTLHLVLISSARRRSRMPGWVQPMIPRIFYITEKGWNYYPFTRTGEISAIELNDAIIMPIFSFFSYMHAHEEYTVSVYYTIIMIT